MLATLLLCLPAPVAPHDGPPYIILGDEPIGPWIVTIWADPDIGVGTFYVQLDAPEGRELPLESRLRIHVQPSDGSAPESAFDAEQVRRSGGEQFNALVDFPTGQSYRTRFVFDSTSGSGEWETELEATPPGLGRIDLLWYAGPFGLIAFLWIRGMLKARARARAA